MTEEYDIGPHSMPPKKSTQLVCIAPERLAEREAALAAATSRAEQLSAALAAAQEQNEQLRNLVTEAIGYLRLEEQWEAALYLHRHLDALAAVSPAPGGGDE